MAAKKKNCHTMKQSDQDHNELAHTHTHTYVRNHTTRTHVIHCRLKSALVGLNLTGGNLHPWQVSLSPVVVHSWELFQGCQQLYGWAPKLLFIQEATHSGRRLLVPWIRLVAIDEQSYEARSYLLLSESLFNRLGVTCVKCTWVWAGLSHRLQLSSVTLCLFLPVLG